MDYYCKYPRGITIENVDNEFIALFDSREECEKFIIKANTYGALMRLVRFG